MSLIKSNGMYIEILDCFVMVLVFHKMNSGKISSFLQVIEMFELVVGYYQFCVFLGVQYICNKSLCPFSL